MKIKKKDLNVDIKYLFGIINNTIMTLQNELILWYLKAACLGCIMDQDRLNICLIIEQEMCMRSNKS